MNVNFWITEDEANSEPESGGLVVYTPEVSAAVLCGWAAHRWFQAPVEWGFADFNSQSGLRKVIRRNCWARSDRATVIGPRNASGGQL